MSFGVGALTTNRFQPPEKVGDPLPPKASPGYGPVGAGAPGAGAPSGQQLQFAAVPPTGGAAAAGGSGAAANGGGNRYSSRAATGGMAGRGSGAAGGAATAAAVAAAAGRAGASQTFMPFAAPTYSIPAPTARGKVSSIRNTSTVTRIIRRTRLRVCGQSTMFTVHLIMAPALALRSRQRLQGPRGDATASQAASDLSLPGVYTQPAAVAGGTTQGTLPATQAITGLGGASQLAGGAAAAALPYGFTADFSQTSGYGGLGAAGVGMGMGVGTLGGLPGLGLGGDVDFNSQVDNFLLSQGFGNETQFLDAATGEFLGGFGGATQVGPEGLGRRGCNGRLEQWVMQFVEHKTGIRLPVPRVLTYDGVCALALGLSQHALRHPVVRLLIAGPMSMIGSGVAWMHGEARHGATYAAASCAVQQDDRIGRCTKRELPDPPARASGPCPQQSTRPPVCNRIWQRSCAPTTHSHSCTPAIARQALLPSSKGVVGGTPGFYSGADYCALRKAQAQFATKQRHVPRRRCGVHEARFAPS